MDLSYKDINVINSINKNFIAIKVDCESEKNLIYQDKKIPEYQLATDLSVISYTNTMFFDSNNNYLDLIVGYVDKNNLSKKLLEVSKISIQDFKDNQKIFDAISKNDLKTVLKLDQLASFGSAL